MSEPVHVRRAASPPGIKDIARALGISIGTVDRALHDRHGISAMTRAKVLKMAQTLGYEPNAAARHLKLNCKLRISVHLPRHIACFYDSVRNGIEEAAQPFRSTVELHFGSYPRLGEGDRELFAETLEQGTNGLIVTPGHPVDLKPLIRKAARAHVPVVCVATDAPGTERLASIAVDAFSSGAMVAELLMISGLQHGKVLIVTGDLTTEDHAEKTAGFSSFFEKSKAALEMAAVIEAHDDPERAYALSREFLSQHRDTQAVYVATANSVPVLEALKSAGLLGRVRVITTDLFPALAPFIRDGKILATLYQRPKTQGNMAFQALHQFLAQGTCPSVRHRLPPHLVLRSNLDVFLEMLPVEAEEAITVAPPARNARSEKH